MPAFGNLARITADRAITDPDGWRYTSGGDFWAADFVASLPPAVSRATALLVNPLCRLPWVIGYPTGEQSSPGDGGYPAWLTDPQLLGGSSGGSNVGTFPMLDRADRFSVFSRWVTSAMWVGVGLLAFTPDRNGQPLAGTVQNVAATRLYKSPDAGWGLATKDGHVEPVDERGMVAGQRLLPLRHSLPGGIFGWHRASFRAAQKVAQYTEETFDSDIPTGVITTEGSLNQSQADLIRSEHQRRQSEKRGVAVFGNGAKYFQTVVSPVDSELVEMSRLTNQQIAHAFELPAWYLDAGENDFTYSNSRDWRQDLVDGPLASWSARLEETLSSLFPWGTRLRIDFTDYTTQTTPEVGNASVSDPA